MNNGTDNNIKIDYKLIFPDTIIGIGGAGKKLVFSLLNKKWILEKMLTLETGDQPKNYKAITVDTAVGEHSTDTKRRDNILRNVNNIQQNFIKEGGRPNNLDVSCQLLLTRPLLGEPDIMGKQVVDGIKQLSIRQEKIKYWWFYPPDIGNDLANKLKERENFSNLDFAGGVVRRRALGKAILYKAISDGINIGLTRSGSVAIIVGLGGGTGSGTFIDYARKLKENSPSINITLFAVLPTSHERDKEQANAYVGLCEIEHMAMNGELKDLFEHVILLPMEPTMYRDDNNMVEDLMDEFHEAFAYTFMSNFCVERNVPRDGYAYAPFIIASSCIVRYNIETNRKIIDSFNSALLSKLDAFKIEKDINSTIDNFYKELKGYKEKGLGHEDNQWLLSRLTDLKKLLFTDKEFTAYREFFINAGYQCFQTFGNSIKNGEDKAKSDNILEKIKHVNVEISVAKIKDAKGIDSSMKDIVNLEPLMISDMAKLFSMANSMQDHNEIKILSEIIRKEGPYPESKLWIEESIRDKETKSAITIENIDALNRKLEEYKRNTEINITDAQKRSDIKDEIQKLQKIENKDFQEIIKNKHDKLTKELEECTNEINKRGINQLDVLNINNLKRNLEDFHEDIKLIDNKFSTSDILNAVENAKNYRKATLVIKKGIPITDKVLKIIVETKAAERIKRAEEEKKMYTGKIRDSNVFETKKDDSIALIFNYDIDKKLKDRIDIIMKDVVSKLNIVTKPFGSELSDEQANVIRTSIKTNNFDIGFENVLKDIIKYNETIARYEEEINKHKIDLDNIEKKKTFLTELYKLYNTIYKKIDEYREKIDVHKYNIQEFEKSFAETSVRSQFDDRYVFQIEPPKGSNVVGRNNIKDFLSTDRGEDLNLLSKVGAIIDDKLFSRKYNGLSNQCIQYGSDRWSVFSVALCTSSLKRTAIDKKNGISALFRITDTRKIGNIVLEDTGDTWDIGITLFVSGIFLDNIVNVADPNNGYYAAYQKVKNNMKELTFLHHTYLLEKGSFVGRELIQLGDEDNQKLFASNNRDDIINKIKSCQKIIQYVNINNNGPIS